jgi:hypothetical protein
MAARAWSQRPARDGAAVAGPISSNGIASARMALTSWRVAIIFE